MNTKDAIVILRREGFIVEEYNDKYKIRRPCDPLEPRYVWYPKNIVKDINNRAVDAAELIGWARCYTSDDKRNTRIKSNIKHSDHRKNRRRTKQFLKHDLYDDIPSKKAVYKENRWNWD